MNRGGACREHVQCFILQEEWTPIISTRSVHCTRVVDTGSWIRILTASIDFSQTTWRQVCGSSGVFKTRWGALLTMPHSSWVVSYTISQFGHLNPGEVSYMRRLANYMNPRMFAASVRKHVCQACSLFNPSVFIRIPQKPGGTHLQNSPSRSSSSPLAMCANATPSQWQHRVKSVERSSDGVLDGIPRIPDDVHEMCYAGMAWWSIMGRWWRYTGRWEPWAVEDENIDFISGDLAFLRLISWEWPQYCS